MEGIMDSCMIWKPEAIRHCPNVFTDLIWPDVLGGKLGVRSRHQRVSGLIKQSQPYPVVLFELKVTVLSIVVLTCIVLCLSQPSLHFCQELSSVI
jgi:hypothetical protein